MIKKITDVFIRFTLILLLLTAYVVEPMEAKAQSAKTLAGLRQELSELQARKKANENEKKQTQSEINAKNKAISDAYSEIEVSQQKVNEAQSSIENSNQKIKEYEEQTNELMKYYQLLMGDNAYFEFISDSSSMTELIMRVDAIAEIVEYNKVKLNELEGLIKENEQLQVEMINYEKELNNNIVAYENKIEQLGTDLLQLADLAMDIDGEITVHQQRIQYYEKLGCKENQDLDECEYMANNSGWMKPLTKGRVTSLFGWRTLNGKSSYHSGVDLGGVSEGTTVYSATSGKVISVLRKQSCGGNQVFVQSIVKGQKYTLLYAHLLSINVSVGDTVTTDTVIGKLGGGSTSVSNGGYDRCTFGAHLHFSVSKGYYKSYSSFVANLINPPGFPSKGAWFYSRTQWFG